MQKKHATPQTQKNLVMKVIKDGKVEPATMVIRNRITNLADDSVTESNQSHQIFDVSLDMIKPVLKRSLYH